MSALGTNGSVLQSIFDRLDALEQSRQGPNETLVPNTYTVDPSGNVNVTGINLPAGTNSTPPNQDRIRWLRQSDGAVVADETAYSQAGFETFDVISYALSAIDASSVNVGTRDTLNHFTGLGISQSTNTSGSIQAIVLGAAGPVIAEDGNRSSFLQLAGGPAARSIAFGAATITFPSSTQATQLTVTHGLGTTPAAILASGAATAPFSGVAAFYPGNAGATTFTVNATCTTVLTGGFVFYWVAIG